MKSALGMCFNWKVLAGLAEVAVAVFLFTPGYALAALPLLVLAACPVSMVGMMWAMRAGMDGRHKEASDPAPATESPEAIRARIAALRAEEARLERQLVRPAPATADGSTATTVTCAEAVR